MKTVKKYFDIIFQKICAVQSFHFFIFKNTTNILRMELTMAKMSKIKF